MVKNLFKKNTNDTIMQLPSTQGAYINNNMTNNNMNNNIKNINQSNRTYGSKPQFNKFNNNIPFQGGNSNNNNNAMNSNSNTNVYGFKHGNNFNANIQTMFPNSLSRNNNSNKAMYDMPMDMEMNNQQKQFAPIMNYNVNKFHDNVTFNNSDPTIHDMNEMKMSMKSFLMNNNNNNHIKSKGRSNSTNIPMKGMYNNNNNMNQYVPNYYPQQITDVDNDVDSYNMNNVNDFDYMDNTKSQAQGRNYKYMQPRDGNYNRRMDVSPTRMVNANDFYANGPRNKPRIKDVANYKRKDDNGSNTNIHNKVLYNKPYVNQNNDIYDNDDIDEQENYDDNDDNQSNNDANIEYDKVNDKDRQSKKMLNKFPKTKKGNDNTKPQTLIPKNKTRKQLVSSTNNDDNGYNSGEAAPPKKQIPNKKLPPKGPSQERKPKIDLKTIERLRDKSQHRETTSSSHNQDINEIRESTSPPKQLNDHIKGTLTEMCSLQEIQEREDQNLLSIFELDREQTFFSPITNTYTQKAKHEFAIKAYSRSGGDYNKISPSDIRTKETLYKTMTYILTEIIDSDIISNPKLCSFITKITLCEIAIFVNDRFRAIRKDFTILGEKDTFECITSHEEMVRFMILSLNQTLNIKAITGDQGLYSLYLQQLNSTLTTLIECYDYSYEHKTLFPDSKSYISPNQAEFISYFMLIALKQKHIEFISLLNKIRPEMKQHEQIVYVMEIAKAIITKNWRKFGKIIKDTKCTYLTACVMVLFFTEMRYTALTELSSCSHKDALPMLSISKLCELLLFEDVEECFAFLDWFGIDYNKSELEMNLDTAFGIKRKEVNVVSQGGNHNYIKAPLKMSVNIIEMKKGKMSRKDIIRNTSINNNNNSINTNNIKVINTNALFPNDNDKDIIKSDTDIFAFNNKTKDILFTYNKNKLPLNSESSMNISDILPTNNINEHNLFHLKKSDFDSSHMEDNTHLDIIKKTKTNSFIATPDEIKALETPFSNNNIDIDKSNSNINNKKQDTNNSLSLSNEIIDNYNNYDNLSTLVNILYIVRKNKFSQKIAQFFLNMRLISEKMKVKEKIIKKLRIRKKILIFTELKKNYINSKYNKEYVKELMKFNMNITSLDYQENYYLTNGNNKYVITNFALYSYDELKCILFDKYINNFNSSKDKSFNNNNTQNVKHIHYLQVNFYTTKNMLYGTQMLNNLNINQNIIKQQYSKNNNENVEEITICENDIVYQNNHFSLFIKFILIDQINSLEEYIFHNQDSINKYIYGIIYIDFINNINDLIIGKLYALLDISLGNILKKKFIFILPYHNNEISCNDVNLIQSEFIKIYSKYQINGYDNDSINKNIFYLGNISDFPLCYSKALHYHNNKTLYDIFNTHLSFDSFDLNQKLTKLSKHNNTLHKGYIINKITKDFSLFKNISLHIQYLLFGVITVRVLTKYYYILYSNFTNKLHNIPYDISTDKIINLCNNNLLICKLLNTIHNELLDLFFNEAFNNKSIIEDVRELFNIFANVFFAIINKELYLILKQNINNDLYNMINSEVYEIKKKYLYNKRNPYDDNELFYGIKMLPVCLFDSVLSFFDKEMDTVLDKESDLNLLEETYIKEKKVCFHKMNKWLMLYAKNVQTDKVNTQQNYAMNNIIKHIKDNGQYNYLNRKRERVFNNDKLNEETQIDLQYLMIPRPKEEFQMVKDLDKENEGVGKENMKSIMKFNYI